MYATFFSMARRSSFITSSMTSPGASIPGIELLRARGDAGSTSSEPFSDRNTDMNVYSERKNGAAYFSNWVDILSIILTFSCTSTASLSSHVFVACSACSVKCSDSSSLRA